MAEWAVAKLLGIDLGTSGCKAVLIDPSGRVLAQASAPYPLQTPQPGWTEQDPEDWWSAVQQVLSRIGVRSPDAIGLTGQMHGAVCLDGGGDVIRPAILWNDQRTVAESAEIDRVIGTSRFRSITCNPPLTGFQAPKLLWIRNHEPENFARIRKVLLPKDYVRFRLSSEFFSEVSDASGTALFDVPNRRWSREVIRELGFREDWFPEVTESDAASAETKGSAYLSEGIPIVGGGGDQAAGAVGAGCVAEGRVSASLGTSGVVFAPTSAPVYDEAGATHTFCHANRAWHLMGVMLSCGGALQWFRDEFLAGGTYDELAEMASGVSAGANGLTFLPYLAGERTPHNDPHARAAFVGATLSHGKAEFARAVYEGISFGLADGLDLLRGLGVAPDEIRIVGGGAKSEFWVQMLSDVLGVACVRLEADEGPAFGAALLAGVGCGVWSDVETACRDTVRVKDRFVPSHEGAYDSALELFRSRYSCVVRKPRQ
ncbi:MAG: xylulokinase [Armatimonadetes bacterium]|nr:MAG: xylulokinase [Armatimonadota bacterium]